jgi:3-oxoacyl-[acyl-carrier protein] reductase
VTDDTLLEGRTALVLGIDEIGSGIVRALARSGGKVTGLNPDFDDPSSVGAAVDLSLKGTGALDILVCNALPPARPVPLAQQDLGGLEASLRTVLATTLAMQTAFPLLRASGKGRIIVVGHRYGEGVNEALAAYNMSAWSLVGLVRSAALDWGQHQIATNLLLPFAQTQELAAARARRPAVIDLMVSQLPLRRPGDPVEDIGGAAVFLASDAACFINGQTVCADGGQHIAGPVLNPMKFH